MTELNLKNRYLILEYLLNILNHLQLVQYKKNLLSFHFYSPQMVWWYFLKTYLKTIIDGNEKCVASWWLIQGFFTHQSHLWTIGSKKYLKLSGENASIRHYNIKYLSLYSMFIKSACCKNWKASGFVISDLEDGSVTSGLKTSSITCITFWRIMKFVCISLIKPSF